jgi:hypothetical protein
MLSTTAAIRLAVTLGALVVLAGRAEAGLLVTGDEATCGAMPLLLADDHVGISAGSSDENSPSESPAPGGEFRGLPEEGLPSRGMSGGGADSNPVSGCAVMLPKTLLTAHPNGSHYAIHALVLTSEFIPLGVFRPPRDPFLDSD